MISGRLANVGEGDSSKVLACWFGSAVVDGF